MCKSTLDYNSIKWDQFLSLDTSSESGLRRNCGKCCGAVAGGKNYLKNGVGFGWRVKFNSKLYLAHRIIWVMTYGSIDSTLVIDHLDGNAFNNSICNLTLKTQQHNTQNIKAAKNRSSTGHTGVYKLHAKGFDYITASWRGVDKKQYQKLFSVNKLGLDRAITLAVKYRREQLDILNSLGMNYTERHGM